MAAHYLEFERPIGELESKIEELSKLSETAGPGAFDAEIAALRDRVAEVRRETYANLDAWQQTQIARHPERPHFVDYVGGLIEEFVELRGDRKFADDQAMMGGLGRFRGQPVVVIGQERGHDITTRIKHHFGSARPEGYRKAVRLMDLAEQFALPVLSFVDTGGAYPGIDSEERGVAEAIARGTERCLTLATPMIATITGEGMSGGAMGIAAANRVLIMEHSIYAVISPEGCASILLRDGTMAEGAANAMKISAEDLIQMHIVDRIIPEPVGGAHADRDAAIRMVGDAVEEELRALLALTPTQIKQQRAQRYLAIGRR
ncbi:MAG: acetyl-CoA carboxylase carboxyltransferase subunit alpha [Caulobacterales bacterium]